MTRHYITPRAISRDKSKRMFASGGNSNSAGTGSSIVQEYADILFNLYLTRIFELDESAEMNDELIMSR